MKLPRRLRQTFGRHALVDGIPFDLPIDSRESPALMAAFTIDPERARAIMPDTVQPLTLLGKGVLLVTVIDYRITDIGSYIEFSVAVACTRGRRPAPPLLPFLARKTLGLGQYVIDLPVSTEISVKGGKGIWGMPKHQANLDYQVTEHTVTSQYDLDGRLVMRIEIDRTPQISPRISMGAVNYCAFRGMVMKSRINFEGRMEVSLGSRASARLYLGDHPRAKRIAELDIDPNPMFVAFLPESRGVLDDYVESWFVTSETAVTEAAEGMESVSDLGLDREWLEPPSAPFGPTEAVR